MLRPKIFLALLGAALSFSAVACVEFSDYCSKKIDCEGGNDKDKAACASEAEGLEDAAKDYGCADKFGLAQDCIEAHSVCNNSKFTTGTECSGELQTLSQCQHDASGRK